LRPNAPLAAKLFDDTAPLAPRAVVVSSTRTTAPSTTRTFDANAFVALARGASARIARSRVNPSSARPNIRDATAISIIV
jgi:hypothetical protein|tara:strand:+ start:1854 stop:2093 length:240 start_codon:yes stop_codon:yes gene_type:complete